MSLLASCEFTTFWDSLLTCGHSHWGEQLFLELSGTTKTSASSCQWKAGGRSAEKGSRCWHQSLAQQVRGHQRAPHRVSAHFPVLPGQGPPGPRRARARHMPCCPMWETRSLRWKCGLWGHPEPGGHGALQDPTFGQQAGFGGFCLFIYLAAPALSFSTRGF